ncbi:MAG: glycosyltransferase, partial [Candidatus Nanoarchaeia archaeon]|nr:glycosyltransferase [Candidatus Jingweiarchaeum tengchongense]
WLSSMKSIKGKLKIVENLVEALPTDDFMKSLQELVKKNVKVSHSEFHLVYVGRLHREKMVRDLINMMQVIQKMNESSKNIVLNIIGDGPERDELERLVGDLGLSNQIRFIGYVPNCELPKYLLNSNVFVSTLTGTSLREAAICGLPIVAYNHNWVVGLLKNEKNALLIDVGNYKDMAEQVLRLYTDVKLRQLLSDNIKSLANSLWTTNNLRESLKKAFDN